MKKIGFIDYFLHEWHADHYPEWIEEVTGGEMKVCFAWAKIDCPSGKSNEQWCKEKHIELCSSEDEVIEKSDYLIILSPDNPEMHIELSRKALMSGKPTYVDKTFAQTKEEAIYIFELAQKYNTPCFSSSALRYSNEIMNIQKADVKGLVSIGGGGTLGMYSIHQLEQIVILMGTDAKRIMRLNNDNMPSFLIEFASGANAVFTHFNGGVDFSMHINYSDKSDYFIVKSEFFKNFIFEMCDFFRTGAIKVPHEETISIIAIREAVMKAALSPYEWVQI